MGRHRYRGTVTDIVLFHHAHGRTEGIVAFGESLRRAGHVVHIPDLYEGRRFDTLDDGVAYAQEVGFGTVIARGAAAVAALPEQVVYIGVSLGVLPAQTLAQTRGGALGAVLVAACVPPTEFGDGWPADVPVQVHGMGADPFFAGEGDIDAARALVADAPDAELFVYPGDGHLFLDRGLVDFDAPAAALLLERVLAFLDRA